MFARGHVYDFSPKVICDYLKIPLYDFDDFEKDYDIDAVTSKLLGLDTKWLVKKTLKVSDLILKYASLHKVVVSN